MIIKLKMSILRSIVGKMYVRYGASRAVIKLNNKLESYAFQVQKKLAEKTEIRELKLKTFKTYEELLG